MHMTEKEWENFFSLLSKIVHLSSLTQQEKIEITKLKAEENDASNNLEEFAVWFQS